MPLLGGNECTMAVSMLADGFYFCGKDFKFSGLGLNIVAVSSLCFEILACIIHQDLSFLIVSFLNVTCFWAVKGMQLVKELEKDLKVANVICMVRIV